MTQLIIICNGWIYIHTMPGQSQPSPNQEEVACCSWRPPPFPCSDDSSIPITPHSNPVLVNLQFQTCWGEGTLRRWTFSLQSLPSNHTSCLLLAMLSCSCVILSRARTADLGTI